MRVGSERVGASRRDAPCKLAQPRSPIGIEQWPDPALCSAPFVVPARRNLFYQDDPVESLFVIDQGEVKLSCTGYGETEMVETIVAIRRSPWLLGAASAIAGRPHVVTAETLTRCTLRRLAVERFRSAIDTDLGVARHLQRMFAHEESEHLARLTAMNCLSAEDRFVKLAGDLVAAGSVARADGARRWITPLRHRELASMVGTTPESFSRLLRTLGTRELIERDAKGWIWIPPNSPILSTAHEPYDS